MTELPTALIAALEKGVAYRQHLEVTSSRVQRGDIRFASGLTRGQDDPRLVLVLEVDTSLEFANVLLVHTAPEMACEADAVVPKEVKSVPYDVVVQTDLRGVMWTYQLGSAIGRLDDRVLSALGTALSNSAREDVLGTYRGIQLAGPIDPRWVFKSDEGDTFRSLTSDCTEALLDDGIWIVEPGLLRPELLDHAEDPAALVFELVHWVHTRSLQIGPDGIETLLELDALSVDAWATVGDLGLDIWTAIQSLVEDAATALTPPIAGPSSWRLVTATHLEARARSSEPDAIHYLGLKEPVAR